MPKPHRYKLLLDEGLSPRNRYSILNSRHDVKHLIHDYSVNKIRHESGEVIHDDEVYKFAITKGRLIITFNIKHFRPIAEKSTQTGIIGLSPHLTLDDYIDSRLNALLTRKKPTELFGTYNFLHHQREKVK